MKRRIKKIITLWYTYLAKRSLNSYGEGLHVNKKSTFTRKTQIGKNCHFNGMSVRGKGSVKIGDNFHSGEECIILTSNHNYDGGNAIPYDETTIDKDVIIEDNVWIGTRVIILGGVTLGEGCIIQAGSVVVKDVESCAIYGGAPANFIKKRNIEHYNELKKQGKFF